MSIHSASAAATKPGSIRPASAPFLQTENLPLPNDIAYQILSFAMLNDVDKSLPLVSRTWRVLYQKKIKKFLQEHFRGKGKSKKYQEHLDVLRLNETVEKSLLMKKGYKCGFYNSGASLTGLVFKDRNKLSAFDTSGVEYIWEIGQDEPLKKIQPNISLNLPLLDFMKNNWTLQINSIEIVMFNKNRLGHLDIKQDKKVIKRESFYGEILGTPIFYKGILACILAPSKQDILKFEKIIFFDFVNKKKSNTSCSIQ